MTTEKKQFSTTKAPDRDPYTFEIISYTETEEFFNTDVQWGRFGKVKIPAGQKIIDL